MVLLHEWTLVLFTVLVQAAVGTVFAGECLLRKTEDGAQRRCIRRQSLAAFVFFAVAGLISLGHTGSPLNSFYTLFNIGSSWLSREIAILGLTGIAFLWLAFMRMKEEAQGSEKIAALLVVVLGFILIGVMSRVYRLTVAPAWDSWSGLLAFFGTTFLLGSLWQGAAAGKRGCGTTFGAPLVSLAFVGLILAAASAPLGVPTVSGGVNPATVLLPAPCIAGVLALRMALTVLGVALLALSVIRAASGGKCACVPVVAFALVCIGELLGRSMFYLSYARLGM